MDALAKMVLLYRAANDYRAGASIRQISDKYNVPYETVRKMLKSTDVQMRRAGRTRGR